MADYQLTDTDRIIVGMAVNNVPRDEMEDVKQIHRRALIELSPKLDAIKRSVAMHEACIAALGSLNKGSQ